MSKELDNILDECLDRLIFKVETIEECLRHYPRYVKELEPLLEAVMVTSRLSSIVPSLEFRDKARTQLFSALREKESKKSRSFLNFVWQPRWVAVTAVVLALFLTVGGTTAAASGSMPDDLLYPVKRATERVQLTFTFTTLGKAEFHARMADRRVEEIVYLANESKPEKIEMLATSLDTNLTEIAVLSSGQEESGIMAVKQESEMITAGSAEVMGEERTVKEEQIYEEEQVVEEPALTSESIELEDESLREAPTPAAISSAKEVAPESALSPKKVTAYEKAEIDVETGESGALKAAPAPEATTTAEKSVSPSLQATNVKKVQVGVDQRAELSVTVVSQANVNIPRLRALLDVVPESVKPAIQRAIDISEQGYQKAIESLD
jgi:hypothetical protein